MKSLKWAGVASAQLLIALLAGVPLSADAKGPKGPNDIVGIQDVVPRIGHPGVGVGLANSHSSNAPVVKHDAITTRATVDKSIELLSIDRKPGKKSATVTEDKSQSVSRALETAGSDQITQPAASPNEASPARRAPLPTCI